MISMVLVVGTLICGPAGVRVASAAPTDRIGPMTGALRQSLRGGTFGRDHGRLELCANHRLHCLAEVATQRRGSSRMLAQQPPIGYGATELATAYGLTNAHKGTGTIVVIGAGAYPTLDSDLAIYRSTYHLPACTKANRCFRQLTYQGKAPYQPAGGKDAPAYEEELAVETALDVQMASAACPTCKIISMQVPLVDGYAYTKTELHAAVLHFATGVQTARKLGARAVSISYGYPTDSYSDKGEIATMMTTPGMAIVASSGDSGFLDHEGQWPQNLPTVTSAGGTSLYADATAKRRYAETAWTYAGSGCSNGQPPANGQPKKISKLCGGLRTASDVSAVADPLTGVAVYDSYAPDSGQPLGFLVVGGTSASSPLLAGMYARASRTSANRHVVGPNTLYRAKASTFNDVRSTLR